MGKLLRGYRRGRVCWELKNSWSSARMISREYGSRDWPALHDVHDAAQLVELTLSVGAHAFRSLPQVFAEDGLFEANSGWLRRTKALWGSSPSILTVRLRLRPA